MSKKKRGRAAVIRYLSLRGYDILEEDYDGFVICVDDDDDIHFIDVTMSDKPDKHITNKSRKDFEQVMCKWFAQQDKYVDVSICADVCNLVVLGENRALIRHHVNVQELV